VPEGASTPVPAHWGDLSSDDSDLPPPSARAPAAAGPGSCSAAHPGSRVPRTLAPAQWGDPASGCDELPAPSARAPAAAGPGPLPEPRSLHAAGHQLEGRPPSPASSQPAALGGGPDATCVMPDVLAGLHARSSPPDVRERAGGDRHPCRRHGCARTLANLRQLADGQWECIEGRICQPARRTQRVVRPIATL
jgi:hypothetical protein